MGSLWDDAETPWSRELCEIRYVQGDRISLSSLAELSGRSATVLRKWSAAYRWVSSRQSYQTDLAKRFWDKRLETESDEMVETLQEIEDSHKRCTISLLAIAESYTEVVQILKDPTGKSEAEIEESKNKLEFLQSQLGKSPLESITRVTNSLINTQRLVFGLDLRDPKVLEREAKKFNLLLVEADTLEDVA